MGAAPEGAAEKPAQIVGVGAPAGSLAVAMDVPFRCAAQEGFHGKS